MANVWTCVFTPPSLISGPSLLSQRSPLSEAFRFFDPSRFSAVSLPLSLCRLAALFPALRLDPFLARAVCPPQLHPLRQLLQDAGRASRSWALPSCLPPQQAFRP